MEMGEKFSKNVISDGDFQEAVEHKLYHCG